MMISTCEAAMTSEQIGDYEIEYSGFQVPGSEDWAAYLTIYGPSTNPMHMNAVFPHQRVCIDSLFPTEQAAEAEARKIAMSMIDEVHRQKSL
jgi:hypothetical protein